MLPLEYLGKESLLRFISMERSPELHTDWATTEPISVTRGILYAEWFRPGLFHPNTMAKRMYYPNWLRVMRVHSRRWL